MLENQNTIQLIHDLGRFADIAALQAQYPAGRPGDFARLTSTETIWNWTGAAWVDTLVDAGQKELIQEKPETLAYGQSLMDIHKDRVKADSGSIYPTHGSFVMGKLKELDVLRKTKLIYAPDLGSKQRDSSIYHFLTKGYSAREEIDLVQTTELNQPYLRGIIAPNEVLCAYNGNGEDKYLEHPEIAFASDEAWSICFGVNINTTAITSDIIGGDTTRVGFRYGSTNISPFLVSDSGSTELGPNNGSFKLIGKIKLLHLIADGLGNLGYYLSGVFISTHIVSTDISLKYFLQSFTSQFDGKSYYYRIQAGAMTATQVADEATMIRTWLPEVESVVIGAQQWATSNLDIVCTPQGNVIPEMQLAADEEKIANVADRDFSADTGNWKSKVECSIGSGVLSINSSGGSKDHTSINTLPTPSYNKWYLYSYDLLNYVSGTSRINIGGYTVPGNESGNGVKTGYIKVENTSSNQDVYISGTDLVSDADNISVQEVGWAGLTDLYTWLTTTGGYSVADALKEVAGWCYYNNDPANGAIYGKLYNWYAVKLLQDDIDAFNLANPATPWGWKVPTQADYIDLATTLGGLSIAADKIKMTDEDFWSGGNTGTNESGFTLLGSGFRNNLGAFSNSNSRAYLNTETEHNSTESKSFRVESINPILISDTASKISGLMLRLLKS